MDDTEFLAILSDAADGLDPVEQGRGVGWQAVHEYAATLVANLTAAVETLLQAGSREVQRQAEIAEMTHALEHVSACPVGCPECCKVVRSALDHKNLADFTAQQDAVGCDARTAIVEWMAKYGDPDEPYNLADSLMLALRRAGIALLPNDG
jgi:hypothetical protein